MSYNKFLNTILNSNNSNGNILTIQQNKKIGIFKENLQINSFENENIKIENNDLNSLIITTAQGNSNSSLALQGNLEYSKLVISDFSYEKILDNKTFSLKNENSVTNIYSNVEISSSIFSIDSLYGKLNYVDKNKTIPWISASINETIGVNIKDSGFSIFKKNANIYNMTYVTCNPNDGVSNYDLSDIVTGSNSAQGYNFVNEEGIYTNTLYLRPGKDPLNTSKYLSKNEHIFIIDPYVSSLPGWGFEEDHPLRTISDYNAIYNEILASNNINLRKKSQSIALDLSALANTGKISPGFKFTFVFRQALLQILPTNEYPEFYPAILHSETSTTSINSNSTLWPDFTFDSRYGYISKADFESLSSDQKSYFEITSKFALETLPSSAAPTSFNFFEQDIKNMTGDKIYAVPYYDSLPSPDGSTFPETSKDPINLDGQGFQSGKTVWKNFYRTFGTYSDNRMLFNFFKPNVFLNLGKNSVILNENIDKSLSNSFLIKNSNIKCNIVQYDISDSIQAKISDVFNKKTDFKNTDNIKYFISKIKSTDQIFDAIHANLNDQKIAFSQDPNYYNNGTTASSEFTSILNNGELYNLEKNLTLKIKTNKIDQLRRFNFLNFFQIIKKPKETTIITNGRNTSNSTPYTNRTVKYSSYLLRTKCIFNIPFNNLNTNEQDQNIEDWYYFDHYLIKNKNYTYSCPAYPKQDFSLFNLDFENLIEKNTNIPHFSCSASVFPNSSFNITSNVRSFYLNPYSPSSQSSMMTALWAADSNYLKYDVVNKLSSPDLSKNVPTSKNQISILYAGYNNNRHEWVYI